MSGIIKMSKLTKIRLNNELFYAVKEGNLDNVKELIAKGANVNAVTTWQNTVIYRYILR